jgi:DNA-binding MarR family transcriptional regulator
MRESDSNENIEHARLMLGLLESVERDSAQSQRLLAAEFGVALGLVNAYLKRCVRKGLVKVKTVPARRYAYFLTPQGFAEKSRLTLAYLGRSMSFFREARKDCAETCALARKLGWSRIVLAGPSDLAEICAICGLEAHIAVVAVVAPLPGAAQYIGAPVFTTFDAVDVAFDGVLITDLSAPHDTFAAAVAALGPHRVLAPQLLGIPRNQDRLAS